VPGTTAEANNFLVEKENDLKPKQKCPACGQTVQTTGLKLAKHDRDGTACPGSGEQVGIFLKRVSDFPNIRTCDEKGTEKIDKDEPIHGTVEEDFLDSLIQQHGSMSDIWDTDRLKQVVSELVDSKAHTIRGAASKYGLTPDIVFRMRLWVETEGLDFAVDKLLRWAKKREAKGKLSGSLSERLVERGLQIGGF
jgi:hypothetical protein